MCIYTVKETDELAISLKEYFQNNPFNKEEYRPDKWVVVPSIMKRKKHSEESKQKTSLSLIGTKRSDYTKNKMRESAIKRNRLSLVTHPNGNVETVLNVAEFCRDRNLNASNFKRMLRGERPTSQGFTGFYLPV
jgi:hypothetical protein